MQDNQEGKYGTYIPAKRGPKNKFQSEMCDQVVEAAMLGVEHKDKRHYLFNTGLCMYLGISERSFYRWKKEIPEFEEACQIADTISTAFFEGKLAAGALGEKKINFNSIAMILNNKRKDLYSRSANGANTEINIGTLNNMNLDPKEIERRLESTKAKLRELNYDPEPER